jgi:hypothetical protein
MGETNRTGDMGLRRNPAPAREEQRYWHELKGYIPLSEFGSVSLAVRAAAPDVWARLHPRELDITELARGIAERRTGMPAYLVDDETWEAAMAEAEAERRSPEPEPKAEAHKQQPSVLACREEDGA